MESKIEIYKQKQLDLSEIDNVVDISISQMNYTGTQTPSHQITIDGANPLFVTELVKWMNNRKEQIVSDIKTSSTTTVKQFETDAVAEAQSFIEDPKAFTQIVEPVIEIIPKEEVPLVNLEVNPLLDDPSLK